MKIDLEELRKPNLSNVQIELIIKTLMIKVNEMIETSYLKKIGSKLLENKSLIKQHEICAQKWKWKCSLLQECRDWLHWVLGETFTMKKVHNFDFLLPFEKHLSLILVNFQLVKTWKSQKYEWDSLYLSSPILLVL